MTLQTNAHKKVHAVFENGVRRSEVETIIVLCLNAHPNSWVCVKDFSILGLFMESQATCKQFARVARQMSETGELKRITRGGDYWYCHWADDPPMPTAAR